MDITQDTATSLGSKIAALDLTAEELRLLQGVLAEPGEVEGYGDSPVPKYLPMIQGPIQQRYDSEGNKGGNAETTLWKSDGTTAVWSMHGGQT